MFWNFLLSFSVVIGTLVSVEYACFLLNRSSWAYTFLTRRFDDSIPPPFEGKFEIKTLPLPRIRVPELDYADHSQLDFSAKIHSGYVKLSNGRIHTLKPNGTYRSFIREKVSGKTVYDVQYSLDEYGRRKTPQENEGARKKHALFFGCSYTMGEGVEDNQTLPSAFARSAPSYHAYNMGFSGSGPQGVLDRIRTSNFLEGVNERDGIGVYLFMSAHVDRVLGRMGCLATWCDTQAYAFEDSAGEINIEGTFETSRPYLIKFYKFFWGLEFRKFFKIDWPTYRTQKELGFFARVVSALKKEYQRKFGNNEFYVVFYPGQPKLAYDLKQEFEKLEIKYLDYSNFDLSTMTEVPVRIPLEGHPSAEAYRIVGGLIARDLGLTVISKHQK